MDALQTLTRRADVTPARGMRVLILDFDLYNNVGGGQSVYQRLIALRPRDTFYYFRRREPEGASRPGNTVAIPLVPLPPYQPKDLPRRSTHFFNVYRDCCDIASSVRRHLGRIDFDTIDVPDYSQLGLFIRPTLEAEGIRVGSVALALHGALSTTLRAGWPGNHNDAPTFAELRMRERLQFRAVDARYAISTAYANYWHRCAPLEVNAVDPLVVVGPIQPTRLAASSEAPDLAFIGRREKCKGPDLFVDLAWYVDSSLYRRLLIIGPDGPNLRGVGSTSTLADMARMRGLLPEIVGSQPRAALERLFESRTLLLLPSRHDTFNLIALEALARGCPVVVSEQAGFSTWVRQRAPELEWLLADISCGRSAADMTTTILRNYDAYRDRLVDSLLRLRLQPDFASVQDIYRTASQRDIEARQITVDLAAHFQLQLQRDSSRLYLLALAPLVPAARLGKALARWTPPSIRRQAAAVGQRARTAWNSGWPARLHWPTNDLLLETIRRATGMSPRTFTQVNGVRTSGSLRGYVVHAAERRRRQVIAKIKHLAAQIPTHQADRIRLFREMIRLERKAGRDVIATTYALRVMRWLGSDVYGDLPFVRATLLMNGFPREAAVASAMFGSGSDSFDRCLDLMQSAYADNRDKPDLPLAVLDDRRGSVVPRVAVIVSLYNAADKLPTLLTTLNQQSLASRGELEVVLVDSNSPTEERQAFASFAAAHKLPIVYARSEQRETIQAAWNRGIKLSRAPYLSFLGVDEGLHPDALRQLAAVLDADPGVDWAMADSLATKVDQNGVFDADIMPYDRRGYRQDLVYLETAYLSWVGGLYRRSIHDRFGWYDESFRAAGDTEFKCRVMPHIRSVHVPKMLGVFNNYPEERTTQHPRAEIEDLRAWYLWRTVAGMHYAFAQRPAGDAVRLLQDCLSYRKSFCGHWSTDFDLADALAEYLSSRPDAPAWTRQAPARTAEMLALLRGIDLFSAKVPGGFLGISRARWLHAQVQSARQMAVRHREAFAMQQTPEYEVFNDNRYEQHWYSWSNT